MTCDELLELIPDLVDGTLPPEILTEAQTTLPNCPDCQRQLEIAQRVREVLAEIRLQGAVNLPAGFEARLIARIQQQNAGIDLLDLSSRAFGVWLTELVNLIGGLLNLAESSRSQTAQ